MSEEVKKHRSPPDPNSAKYKLGQIAAKAYSDAWEAKERGEMVGWCASNFPVEIPETLGLAVVYPENQAAAIAARGAGARMCEISEADGYSNDGYSNEYSGRRGYSRDEAKDKLIDEMEGMMGDVSPEAQHAIQKAIRALGQE